MEEETEGKFVPLKKALISMVANLEKIRDSPNIKIKPEWLGNLLGNNLNDITANSVTAAMMHELSAVIDLSIARSEREREELTEEQATRQVAFEKEIAEAIVVERVLNDLKDELQASSEKVQKQKECLS